MHQGSAIIVLAAIAAVGMAGQEQPARQVYRSAVRTVFIYATVTQTDGRLVPDLGAADFEVLDNGKPQTITVFESGSVPITAALMLDTSGSTKPILSLLRAGAVRFVEALRPEDKAVVGSFGAEIAVSPHLTGDHRILKRVIAEEFWPGGPTPLWNAIHAGMDAVAPQPGRRVVVVFTDGRNNIDGFRTERSRTHSELMERVRREELMVYAIRPARADPLLARRMDRLDYLLDIVRESGGGFFDVRPSDDLASVFAKVAAELHHQYLIGFSPAILDGQPHKLEIRVRKRDMRARGRTTYLAVPE